MSGHRAAAGVAVLAAVGALTLGFGGGINVFVGRPDIPTPTSTATPTPTATPSCTTTLSAGANIATSISSATAGDTICLNSGVYSAVSLPTTTKSPRVTVKAVTPLGPQVGGINVGAATPNGITIDGITLTADSDFGTSNHATNVTIQNSAVGTHQIDIRTNVYNNQNVQIGPGDTFGAFDKDPDGSEGRVTVAFSGGPGSNNSGVTVTGNDFGPGGCSDGINIGARGVQVIGNTFHGIVQGGCATHVDSIQGFGDAATTLDGNFFTGDTVCFGWYDDGSDHTFTDNVCSGDSVASFRGLSNSTISHNTFEGATFRINGKTGDPSTLTIQNNLFHGWSLADDWGCTTCTISSNMFDSGGTGTGNVTGSPTYTGGATPSTYAGFQLTTGSTGHNAASDGADMGARF